MDIKTIIDAVSAIPQLQKEIEDLKIHVAELYLIANAGQMEMPVEEMPPPADPELENQLACVRKIEAMVIARIPAWKYSERKPDGQWRCPLNAGRVAEFLGDRGQWRMVRGLMKNPELWARLRWYHAPPPPNYRNSDHQAKAIQWVEVVA